MFRQEEIAGLEIPAHVAIIPDGNRRWAKSQSMSVQKGHNEGADVLMDTLRAAKALGIKALTVYAFSTENWSRTPEEVAGLMFLIESYILNELPTMLKEGVRFFAIGDLSALPESLQGAIDQVSAATAGVSEIDLILALNYGARDEIVRACKKIIDAVAKGHIQTGQIDEALFSKKLDTAPWSDPDLLIRTSGESRLSNFMLWQLSYAEIYVTPVLWPDFTPAHLLMAVVDYQKRERRRGGEIK